MDKIVVSSSELANLSDLPTGQTALQPKLPSPIHWSVKLVLSLLVLFLPVLCLVAIILRVSFRNQPPRVQHAWTAFLSTLLIISGFLTSTVGVLVFSLGGQMPTIVGTGLDDLDVRQQFPTLPSASAMDGVALSQTLKPLVVVVAPDQKGWFSRRRGPVMQYGAGLLLLADEKGYLFATARHVVDLKQRGENATKALIATVSGVWSEAEVVARHDHLDAALLWVPRHDGHGTFVQPIGNAEDGEPIFVIGHPEGLKFTLSNGIVSRIDNNLVQISAPVSPGNSGGPVYDARGDLVGVVSWKLDHNADPNAENLNFAVSAAAMTDPAAWDFFGNGREYFDRFVVASHTIGEKP
jgi:S1-C subfamily serine protease